MNDENGDCRSPQAAAMLRRGDDGRRRPL